MWKDNSRTGGDDFGFGLLPNTTYGSSDLWTSTSSNGDTAYSFYAGSYNSDIDIDEYKYINRGVRCIKD